MIEEPITESNGGEDGTVEIKLVGRGKMPERGLRNPVPGGSDEFRVGLVSKLELVFE